MRGNRLLFCVSPVVIPVFAQSSRSIVFLSATGCLSCPICLSFLFLLPSPFPQTSQTQAKREHQGWSGLVTRGRVWGFLFISSFEVSLHLKYAHDIKEVAISIHIILKTQTLVVFLRNEDFVGLWAL